MQSITTIFLIVSIIVDSIKYETKTWRLGNINLCLQHSSNAHNYQLNYISIDSAVEAYQL